MAYVFRRPSLRYLRRHPRFVASASIGFTLGGVAGTGGVGDFAVTTGNVAATYGTGQVGLLMPSTLQVNPRRTLSNVLRRLRTLSRDDAQPT